MSREELYIAMKVFKILLLLHMIGVMCAMHKQPCIGEAEARVAREAALKMANILHERAGMVRYGRGGGGKHQSVL